MRQLTLVILCLTAILSSATAIEEVSQSTYPTVTAFAETIIPIADRVELAQRLLGVGAIPPAPTNTAPRTLGERQRFNIAQTQTGERGTIEAELRAIGQHVYVWVDTTRIVSDNVLQRFAQRFDTEVYEQTRALWGSEATPGIDGDPRLYALFTPNVSRGLAAYFAGQNSYSRLVFPDSNEHDMMIFNLDAFNALDDNYTISVAAHEFQHMIRRNIDTNEEAWVDEGLSMLTEYLLGNPIDDTTDAFLASPQYQVNAWGLNGNRVPNYGAAALFLLYFRERYGAEALRQVSDNPANGLQAIDAVLNNLGAGDVNSFFADWVVANAIDGDAPYGYPSARKDYRITPRPIQSLPANFERDLSQYATHYYGIAHPLDVLNIKLSLPPYAQVIDSEREGTFFYSNRGDDSNMRLTRAFDLRDVSSASLAYDIWFEIESGWDYGYVSISTNGGTTWKIQPTRMTTQENPYGKAYGEGFTSVSVGWVRDELQLDEYVGKEILVRFELITDDSLNEAGLALDNMRLDAIEYSADFEQDAGGWLAEGWLRTDNRLPQEAWLQIIEKRGTAITLTRWQTSGESQFSLPLQHDTEQVIIAISPFAPTTTEATAYILQLD